MELIGNTPMIKIIYEYNGYVKDVYVKLEYFNLTGSIKDRMVSYILEHSYIKPGQVLVEATSGNTGISLSAMGARMGNPVVIFMPDFVSSERVSLMRMYGADVHLISKEDGGFNECLKRACDYTLKHDGFLLNQFSNPYNALAHYETTSLEILDKINDVDGFISGVGSGGTLMGIGKRLKEHGAKIVALEPLESPIIKNGISGYHKIEGIGDDFIPDIFDGDLIDDIYLISDMEAIRMSQKIALELGIGVGISSGANLLGAIMLREMCNKVVTIFPDDNKKYLSTDLRKKLDGKYLSDKIKLISYEVI